MVNTTDAAEAVDVFEGSATRFVHATETAAPALCLKEIFRHCDVSVSRNKSIASEVSDANREIIEARSADVPSAFAVERNKKALRGSKLPSTAEESEEESPPPPMPAQVCE